MTSEPEISIVIPTFNAQQYLSEALDSIVAQSFENFEVLVTDDCSTDGTEEIVMSYGDKRIKFLRNEHKVGSHRNYNVGYSLCRGKFIKPFAQDDLLHKNQLELMRKVLIEHNNVSLVSCARRIFGEKHQDEIVSSFDRSGIYVGRELQAECLRRFVHLFNLIGEPCCAMFRREHLAEGCDVNYYHMADLDMWIRILGLGDLYYFVEPLCSYRQHDKTHTKNSFKSMYYMLDFLRILDKHRSISEEVFGSMEEAYLHVVEHMGRFIYSKNSSSLLDIATISLNLLDSRDPIRIQSGTENATNPRPTTLTDDEYFRQIALFALLKLGANCTVLDATYSQLKRTEQELKDVYESKSWRATRILRGLSRTLHGNSSVRVKY